MDLCVAQSVGCDSQQFWGMFILAVIATVALIQMIWSYWSGYHDQKRRQMATPRVVRMPVAMERRNQAVPVKVIKSRRFPMRGWDKIIGFFIQGGSISGF